MSKKHVNSRDPRKAAIVTALKRKSGGTKVTNVTETVETDQIVTGVHEKDIKVFSGDCMRVNRQGTWDRLGTFHVQESEIS